MRALNRKLLRDLSLMGGQAATIALVVACGIASYVSMRTTWRSLERSRDGYYTRYRFADVFGVCKRAPETVLADLAVIPGVAQITSRVVADVLLPLDRSSDPATGKLIAIPEVGEARLNGLFLRAGRLPEEGHSDEVVALEPFARGNNLGLGDRVAAVVNGRYRDFRIVGLGLSPEYVMPVSGSSINYDPKRFGVLWLHRRSLAPLMQMEGAFNDVALTLQPGASEPAVIAEVRRQLDPYGALSVVPRSRQASHLALQSELQQLRSFAFFMPAMFLGVAIFLVNVVLSRLVAVQRTQIASLKALGYAGRQITLHYLALVSIITVTGALGGVALGGWLGGAMTSLYAEYFHFPLLDYRIDADVVTTAMLLSIVAGAIGAMIAVRAVIRMPPAQAMRPPAPEAFGQSALDRLGLLRLLPASWRMILREITRRPLRLALSSLGIAFAVGILVMSRFFGDAIGALVDMQFQMAQRESLAVVFNRAVSSRVVRTIATLPGVTAVEPQRAVPVRLRNGTRRRDTALLGHPKDGELRRLVEWPYRTVPVPERGLLLTDKLAELLDVRPGDRIEVERLDGDHRTHLVPIAGVVAESMGLQAHMQLEPLAELFGEPPLVSGVLIAVERDQLYTLTERLRDYPVVQAILRREALIEQFREQSGRTMLTTTLLLTLFAAAIAVGIVYNNARITLEIKNRDLASLRVLGFFQREIEAILLGELAVQVLVALPLGLYIGRTMVLGMMSTIDAETFRMPLFVSARAYVFATSMTLVIALGSALLVRRQLRKLDLIGVLKTRE